MRSLLASVLAALVAVPAFARAQQPAAAAPFTQADLEALVAELDAVVPHNENYAYPIEAKLVEQPVVNAWTFVEPRDDKLVPKLELMRGMVDLAGGDKRLLRAVLAHELAHLSLGHALEGFPHADLAVVHTRQQEFEADSFGSSYLVLLGHGTEDMADVMKLLDQDMRRDLSKGLHPWLAAVTGNHASPITRAARLTGDQGLLAAVSRFEIGLAYMDCRRYAEALAYFDEAKALHPTLLEADADAASAALQNYYDRLPAAVQEEWLRPEFGPHLTDVFQMRGRAIAITDDDVKRYEEALARIERMLSLFEPPMQDFLRATAQVLHPRGDEPTLRKGVAALQGLLDGKLIGLWDAELLRLRVANNLALGLQRLGEEKRAGKLLLGELKKNPRYLPALAENLARLPLEPLESQDAVFTANVLFTHLTWTPVDAPGARAAQRAIEGLKKKHGLQVTSEPKRPPLLLCAVATIAIDGREVGLFQHFTKVSEILGTLPAAGAPNPRLPDLQFLLWGQNEVVALMEGEQLVKLTSYRPDSVLELRPMPESGLREVYRVRIGMTEAEFEKVLAPAGGSKALEPQTVTLLGRRSFSAPAAQEGGAAGKQGHEAAATQVPQEEIWRYYPGLNFGVLIEDGRVTGITVAPAAG
jgi:tetratricopeptide (TPR) repeat protein